MAIYTILRSFGIFCGNLEYFMVIRYIFSRFGMLYQEKSGNPARFHQFPKTADLRFTAS
jgi:hypothetical protein